MQWYKYLGILTKWRNLYAFSRVESQRFLKEFIVRLWHNLEDSII